MTGPQIIPATYDAWVLGWFGSKLPDVRRVLAWQSVEVRDFLVLVPMFHMGEYLHELEPLLEKDAQDYELIIGEAPTYSRTIERARSLALARVRRIESTIKMATNEKTLRYTGIRDGEDVAALTERLESELFDWQEHLDSVTKKSA